MTTAPTAGAPTALTARALAPDLSRGAMLLLIALANAHVYLHGHEVGTRGYPVDGSAADRAVTWLLMTAVDGRAYPLFALLFGYGLAQLTRRLTASGLSAPQVRRLLRRRSRWLLLLGLLHAGLLFAGDILGAYAVLGLLLAGAVVGGSDRRLLVGAGLWLVPLTLLGLGQGVPLPDGTTAFLPSMGTSDPLAAAGWRLVEWVGLTLYMVLSTAAAVLLGVWAARHRLLEGGASGRFLVTAAAAGLGTAVLGAQPLALMAAGLWEEPAFGASLAAGALHTASGYGGGIGYAALAALVALWLHDRRGAVASALVATGQRSLTCYLLQSVAFVAVLASYGGGLGDRLGVAAVSVVALLTWLATVGVAVALQARGRRGPFEVALRRLTYR